MPMSAYIVEDKTINTIVTWLRAEFRESSYVREIAKKFAVDVEGDGWEKNLAKAMHELNVTAVNQRYGEEHKPNGFVYTPIPYGSRIAAFKSLQCWMYQCFEGDVPQTKLYQYFEELEKRIAISILMDLPEYEKTLWG